jgi:uncharacterized protein YjbI with pentapeptide repeats
VVNSVTMDGILEFEAWLERLKAGKAIEGALFSEKTLAGLQLSGAQMRYTKFDACDLSAIDLTDARMPNLLLSKCVLGEANLSGADLSDAIVINTSAGKAKFVRTILTGVKFFSDNLPVKDSSQVIVSFEHMKLPDFMINQLKGLGILGFKVGASNFNHADFSSASVNAANLKIRI